MEKNAQHLTMKGKIGGGGGGGAVAAAGGGGGGGLTLDEVAKHNKKDAPDAVMAGWWPWWLGAKEPGVSTIYQGAGTAVRNMTT